MTRPLRLSLPLALVLLALGCLGASAADAKKVAVGDYQASPIVPADQTYGVGVFSVAKVGAKREIARTDGYLGIYYPDDGKCDSFDLPLAAETIPISSTGRFKIKEKTPVEDTFVKVVWKGRWTKPGVVGGSITIAYDGCSSTRKWSGGKVVAAG
jgi:hypothetical protein